MTRFEPVRHGARLAVLWLAVLWLPVLAWGADAPGRAGIATPHPLATEAGHQVLAAGGNAFDAAVAISAVLAVVEPYGSGLGGGGFWLLHRQSDGLQVMVDGRETAPGEAHADMYLDDEREPVPGLSRDGALAAGIPGAPAALVHIAREYGTLPLNELLEPAVRHAEQGFEVYQRMLLGLQFRREQLLRSPAAAGLYFPDGELVAEGDLLRQPELARTLRRLAEQGHDGFYRGPVAEALVDGVREAGGIWSLDDLAAYRVVEREPVTVDYRGSRVVAASLPSSGGVVLATVLNVLEQFDLDALEPATRKHLLIEAMRRGYRDRAVYLGDPDFVAVPVERLTHPLYAAGLAAGIRLDRASRSADLPGISDEPGGTQTTHFSVLDAAGNRVAATLSLNSWYGAALMPEGTGVMLNNEMDDFSTRPGVPDGFQLVTAEANAIAPGKRMLSSMTPAFVESPRGVAILGTPGGARIISTVLLGALEWLDGGDAEGMVGLRRYHHQYLPDAVSHERGAFAAEVAAALEAMGHTLRASNRDYGNMQVVTWEYDGARVDAASDPRGEGGEALVY